MIFNLFKTNKVTKVREKLKDPKWVINKYEELIRSYKENIDRFESFECNDFFKGRDLAEHNRRILGRRRIKYESRKVFLQNILKKIDTVYYIKYIGNLTDEEMEIYKRSSSIDEILK